MLSFLLQHDSFPATHFFTLTMKVDTVTPGIDQYNHTSVRLAKGLWGVKLLYFLKSSAAVNKEVDNLSQSLYTTNFYLTIRDSNSTICDNICW